MRIPSSRARAKCGALQQHNTPPSEMGQAQGAPNTTAVSGVGERVSKKNTLLRNAASLSAIVSDCSGQPPLGDASSGDARVPERAAQGTRRCDTPGSWTQMLRRCSLSTLFMLSMNVVGMSLRSGHMRKLCCWQPNDLWGSDAKP